MFVNSVAKESQQACQHHCSLRNEGVQQICQIDVGHFHRCKVYNIYYVLIMLEEVHVKLCRITKSDLWPEIDVGHLAELRNEHV